MFESNRKYIAKDNFIKALDDKYINLLLESRPELHDVWRYVYYIEMLKSLKGELNEE